MKSRTEAFPDRQGLLPVDDLLQEDDVLVPTVAGQGVIRANALDEAAGDLYEDVVADVVPEPVMNPVASELSALAGGGGDRHAALHP